MNINPMRKATEPESLKRRTLKGKIIFSSGKLGDYDIFTLDLESREVVTEGIIIRYIRRVGYLFKFLPRSWQRAWFRESCFGFERYPDWKDEICSSK